MVKATTIYLFCVIVTLCMLISGCQTMTMDKEQHIRHLSRVSAHHKRMLAEDVDSIFMINRPSRLSNWHVPDY